jgi:hypothetical protein
MSIQIRAQPLQYPQNESAPSTFLALLQAIAQYTLYMFDQDYILAVKGQNTPQVQDNNKLWIKTDSVGRPLGMFVMYNGVWRQVATGLPQQITMFAGDWTLYFDDSGLGQPGQPWDGWAVANGNNDTVDLTNQFVIPGYNFLNGQWLTNITGADTNTGGRSQFTIALANLPPLSITVGSNNTFGSGGGWFASTFPGGGSGNWVYPVAGTGADIPISTLPPFIALGFLQYVGYSN